MKSRFEGMWWGTAMEAPDPSALARFYSQLLDWPIGHEEPGTAIVAARTARSTLFSNRPTATNRRCGHRPADASAR